VDDWIGIQVRENLVISSPINVANSPTEFQKTHQKAKVTYMAQLIVTKNAVAILLRLSITPP
jgi:hypothetical protein